MESNAFLKAYFDSSRQFFEYLGIDLNDLVYEEGKSLGIPLSLDIRHCGYKKVVHGGVIAAILDAITGVHAMIIAECDSSVALTRRINVVYNRKITPDMKLYLYSELGNRDEYELACSGMIMSQDRKTSYASCLSLFVEKPITTF